MTQDYDNCYQTHNTVPEDMLFFSGASALDFKDAAPRFYNSDVVFDPFIETSFFAFNHPVIRHVFQNILSFLGITGPKWFDFILKNTTNSVY